MCSSSFANLLLLLNHWMRVHGQDANLNIVCGVRGCGRTYRNFFGYRSHLQRNHNHLWKNTSEITELCDLVNNEDHNIEQNLSDDSDDDATNGASFIVNGEKLDNMDFFVLLLQNTVFFFFFYLQHKNYLQNVT